MSKVKVDMIRCDLCPSQGATFTVWLPGAIIDVDLCDTHAQPLLGLAERGRPSTTRRPAKGRNDPAIRVTEPVE